MKTLSIQQPWAWAILHAGKDIENRTWPTRYRGPILIHAAKKYDKYGHSRIEGMLPADYLRIPTDLQRGGIVGRAEIVDCIRRRAPSKWYEGPFGFVLRNVQPIAFFPWPGKLGLFDFPDELLPRLVSTTVTAPQNDNDARSRGEH